MAKSKRRKPDFEPAPETLTDQDTAWVRRDAALPAAPADAAVVAAEAAGAAVPPERLSPLPAAAAPPATVPAVRQPAAASVPLSATVAAPLSSGKNPPAPVAARRGGVVDLMVGLLATPLVFALALVTLPARLQGPRHDQR